MVVHPDVAKALRERRAVVALESTIVCHGMPYPQNLQTANEVEDVVRDGECPERSADCAGAHLPVQSRDWQLQTTRMC